ncbi:ATP-binding cassette sub-family C member 5-like [Glandiceps talaboti]
MADTNGSLVNEVDEPLVEGAKGFSAEDNITDTDQNSGSLHGEVVNGDDIHTKQSDSEEKRTNDDDTGIDNDVSNTDDKNKDDSEPVEIEPEEISDVRSTSTSESKGEIEEDFPSVDDLKPLVGKSDIETDHASDVRSISTSESKGEIEEDFPSIDDSRPLVGKTDTRTNQEKPPVSSDVHTPDKKDREDMNGHLSSQEEGLDSVKVGFLPSQEKGQINASNSGFTAVSLDEGDDELKITKDKKKAGSKYSDTMKMLIPIRSKVDKSRSPLDQVGFFSYITVNWINRIVYLGYKNKLTMDKILPCSPKDAALVNAIRLERHWNDIVERDGVEKASFNKACIRLMRFRLVMAVLTHLFFPIGMILTAGVIIRAILEYLEQPEEDLTYGLLLVLALLGSETMRILSSAAYFALAARSGVRLRTAVITMIYRKMIRLRSLQDKTVGELVNLCTNDAQRYMELMMFVPILNSTLLLGIFVVIYSSVLVGPAALLGSLSAFFVFWPLQAAAGVWSQKIRAKCIKVTDRRIRLMNEILNCVKLIKMYAWEIPFSKTVEGIRVEERKFLEKAAYVQSVGISLGPIVANIATVLTITVLLQTGHNLTASTAFTLVSVFNTLRVVIAVVPWVIKVLAETNVAQKRIKQLLLMEELEPTSKTPTNKNHAIVINNGTFAWDKEKNDDKKNEEKEENVNETGKVRKRKRTGNKEKTLNKKDANGDAITGGQSGVYKTTENQDVRPEDVNKEETIVKTLFDIDVVVTKGELLGICGSVGSGKSSLISAILSQMRVVEGEVAVDGSLAYVAQQAWVFNATLRDNILFDKAFDAEKYNSVVQAACLQQDIDMLPHGDTTEIGEKGINLSGGQKQRVSLARALYADCDIYLLDDPLSAVDTHVGQHIFQHYLKEALKEKTIVFVTHQLQYLNQCDKVILMKEGNIEEYGTHTELMTDDKEYAGLIKTFHAEHEKDEEEEEEKEAVEFQRQLSRQSSTISNGSKTSLRSEESEEAIIDDGKLIKVEEMETGAVKASTYNAYIKAGGGYLLLTLIALVFVVFVATLTFNNWWLSYWIAEGSGNTTITIGNTTVISDSMLDNPKVDFYAMIYGLTILVVLLLSFVRSISFMKVCLVASSALHDTVFVRIFRSPMKFFDTTPTGRIINRFSKDMDEIDVWLPLTLDMSLQNFVYVLFAFGTICAVFPWFLIVMAFLVILFILCLKFFRAGIRECKRLDNVSRSPWVSLLTSTIQGLSTIHAYRRETVFVNRFGHLIEDNSVPFMYSVMCGRWIQTRLDFLTMTVTTVTALISVLTYGDMSPALAGLALSYTIQIAGLLNLCVSMGAEAEARFTSVERLTHYCENLEEEAPAKVKDHEPPADWPNEGHVKYQDVKMRYRDGLPLVLKGIKIDIKPMEKVGIVGRTGSGKSSLGITLFRLVEAAEGNIEIDGIDIGKIGLQDLRSKLSIIPQDPVLFVGTVRYNLDPFNEHSDDSLWSALEKAYMKNTISALDKQLEAPVVENGENFSVGERQLICMARALLRNSKILMLDEATAAIDTETDSLIQNTIRDSFKDCTMLTIAHRLNTVLACDRVLVMEDGKVAEFETPSKLLANPESRFSAMMAAAEKMKSEAHDFL